jgi:hypothetical protein
MGFSSIARAFAAASLVLAFACRPAQALVKMNGGTDEIFLNSSISAGYDSNLFANSTGQGDYSYSLVVGAEYTRNAGLIGLKASVSVNATRYQDITSENFNDPTFKADFSKKTGRTTGSLSLELARENRADEALNVRSESWHYGADLNVRYPVIERYSILGNVGYARRDYTNNALLSDVDTYKAGVDLAYTIRTGRDLLAGYSYRQEHTSANVKNDDHSFTVGLSGQILPRLTGSIRAGYDYRIPQHSVDGDFSSWTANSSVIWAFSQRLNVTGQLNKDFSTTATNISTDSLASSLKVSYAMNSKFTFGVGTGWGESDFLGQQGGNRHDNSWNWDASVTYVINPHLNASLTYVSFQNWSTLAFADFTRRNVTLTLSARF